MFIAADGTTSSGLEVKTLADDTVLMPDSAHRMLTIGEVAARAGIATSTLRFYEDERLIEPVRTTVGHRRYHADVLRRVSFIRTAQRVGLSLGDIRQALATLPSARTPNARDWARLARSWQPLLDERIAVLTRLRDQLDECIGCGCLSLTSCGLWNRDDVAATLGSGARYLLSDQRPGT
jgi:MerR family transcriptional regulator, redox-sensitive transcriptional activator SoxR